MRRNTVPAHCGSHALIWHNVARRPSIRLSACVARDVLVLVVLVMAQASRSAHACAACGCSLNPRRGDGILHDAGVMYEFRIRLHSPGPTSPRYARAVAMPRRRSFIDASRGGLEPAGRWERERACCTRNNSKREYSTVALLFHSGCWLGAYIGASACDLELRFVTVRFLAVSHRRRARHGPISMSGIQLTMRGPQDARPGQFTNDW